MTSLVPLIDIAPFEGSDPRAHRTVVEQVRAACERIGFFLIAGHGVPDALIDDTYGAARDFFDLPEAEKLKIARLKSEASRGYNRMADQSLSYSHGQAAPPDLQESLNFGPMDIPDTPYFRQGLGAVHFAPNKIPLQPPRLMPLARAYYGALEGLAARVMRIFAGALELPSDFFDGKIDRHITTMRFVNYPDQDEAPRDGQLRAGAHSDYGSLTILRIEDAPGGLQVRDRDGQWVDVPAIPGSFVINIGDLMQQWTNDRWVSTVHRVVNPPRDKALGSRRISLVFFHQPNYDADVACLPSCQSADDPPRYPPTTSGAHWRAKNQATRTMQLVATTP